LAYENWKYIRTSIAANYSAYQSEVENQDARRIQGGALPAIGGKCRFLLNDELGLSPCELVEFFRVSHSQLRCDMVFGSAERSAALFGSAERSAALFGSAERSAALFGSAERSAALFGSAERSATIGGAPLRPQDGKVLPMSADPQHPNQSNQAIYFAALRLSDERERRAFLEGACGNDVERRQSIERLLAAGAPPDGSPLDRVIGQLGPDETVAEEAVQLLDGALAHSSAELSVACQSRSTAIGSDYPFKVACGCSSTSAARSSMLIKKGLFTAISNPPT